MDIHFGMDRILLRTRLKFSVHTLLLSLLCVKLMKATDQGEYGLENSYGLRRVSAPR